MVIISCTTRLKKLTPRAVTRTPRPQPSLTELRHAQLRKITKLMRNLSLKQTDHLQQFVVSTLVLIDTSDFADRLHCTSKHPT